MELQVVQVVLASLFHGSWIVTPTICSIKGVLEFMSRAHYSLLIMQRLRSMVRGGEWLIARLVVIH